MENTYTVHLGHAIGFCGKNQLIVNQETPEGHVVKTIMIPISKKIRAEIETQFPDMPFEG